MTSPNRQRFENIEDSLEFVDARESFKEWLHPGPHAFIVKVLLGLVVALALLSFSVPGLVVVAVAIFFFLVIPIGFLGEAWFFLKSGEMRVSLPARRTIKLLVRSNNRMPRIVIRRAERPLRFYSYLAIFSLLGISPFLVFGFIVLVAVGAN